MVDYLEELKGLDRDKLLSENQLKSEMNGFIYQLRNTDLGKQIKSEILIPKKVKVDKLYKWKQRVNKFFNLFG